MAAVAVVIFCDHLAGAWDRGVGNLEVHQDLGAATIGAGRLAAGGRKGAVW